MTVAARLSSVGTFSAFEFDDNTNTSFSISVESTVFSNEFDENTSTTLSGNQRMSATSTGGVIVLDSINEIDPFGDVDTTNLELHLDSVDSNVTSSTVSGHPIGQQNFTSSGTFTVPTGVTSVDIVAVGAGGGGGSSDKDDETGGGGGGGALAYVNTVSTTPGESLTVTVGTGGAGGAGGGDNGAAGNASSVSRSGTILVQANGGGGGQHIGAGGAGGTVVTGTGGAGGAGGAGSDRNSTDAGGGGGAGGYSGNGGAGAAFNDGGGGSAGSGGAAGGGGSGTSNAARGGGGVGILGEGTSGAASADGASGNGGSGGANGTFNGGLYGGGGAGAAGDSNTGGSGANGAVRFIWGDDRSYPSTNTGDLTPGTPSTTSYVWEDISGNNRDATFRNTTNTPVEGNFIGFDSANSEYAVLDGAATGASAYTGVTGTAARTVIIALKRNAISTNARPFSYGLNNAGDRFTFRIPGDTNAFRVEFGNGYTETNTTVDTGWHMFAVVVPTGGTPTINDVRIWTDGVEQALTTSTGTNTFNTDSTTNVEIGGAFHEIADPAHMDGQVTKVMIYSRALSDLEIKVIYRSFLNRLV